MQGESYSIFHCSIEPSNFSAFKDLAAELVEKSSQEPDTLTYEYVVNAERTQVHIVERYRGNGFIPHARITFAPYAERFLELVKIDKLFVYGQPTPEAKAMLDGFGAQYFESIAGFTR